MLCKTGAEALERLWCDLKKKGGEIVNDVFFKGYVRTKNKHCTEKYKDRTNLPQIDDVKNCSEYAGILATNTILIDVDDGDQAELLMKMVESLQLNCRVYQTTRGMHFLFYNNRIQKCSTHSTLACGLTADIKVGFSNSYEVLKFNGKERFIIWDVDEGQDYQEIPKWLFPIKGTAEFVSMKAGNGRNQALFNYILTLQSNDFQIEEIRDTIRLINQFLLEDPLSNDELEVILRDEAFSKPVFYKGQTFLFDRFGNYLIKTKHLIRINNQLHIYHDGIYLPGQNRIENAMLEILPGLSSAKRTEVMKYLEVVIIENTEPSPSNYIAFRNGVLNIGIHQNDDGEMVITKDEFLPASPDLIITNRIDWDYNPNAYHELLDITLNKIACQDQDIRKLLEEAAGYAMFRRNELGKAFFLTGTGSNGKSTYLEVLEYMLGDQNTSNLDLKKLGDRFSTVTMFGKLANIGDDISDEFVTDTSLFKKVVTGNRINAENKGQPVFEFNPYTKLYFSANNIPRMGKGRDWEAIKRRMVIIPFGAKFSPSDPDYVPFIGSRLKTQGAMEYFIRLGVEALKRVLLTKQFTVSQKIQKELDEYEESNNPILIFIKELKEDDLDVENQPVQEIYLKYSEFCMLSNLKPMSKAEFTKAIKKALDLDSVPRKINGKSVRLFIKKG